MSEHAKGRPQKRYDCARWLKAYLSGGYRMQKEDIELRAAEQGYGLKTLKRAKAEIGAISIRVGTKWAWRDPEIVERQTPQTIQEQILHEIREGNRLRESPVPLAEDATEADRWTVKPRVNPNELDEHGFRVAIPDGMFKAPATIKADDIRQRIKQLERETADQIEIANKVFEWAYPASGLPESIIGLLLKARGIQVTRADIRVLQSDPVEAESRVF